VRRRWTSLGPSAALLLGCGPGDSARCFDGLDTDATYRLTLGSLYQFSQGEPLFDPDLAAQPGRALPSCGDLEGLAPGFRTDLTLRGKAGAPGADGRACRIWEPVLAAPLSRLRLDARDDAAIERARAAIPPTLAMVMKRSLAALDDGECQGIWTLRLRATAARAGRPPDPTLAQMGTTSVPPLLVDRLFEARERAACPTIAPGGPAVTGPGVTCADTWAGTLEARGRAAPMLTAGAGRVSIALVTTERFEVAYLVVELVGTEGPLRRRWPATSGNVVISPSAPSEVVVEGALRPGTRAVRLKAVAFNAAKLAETAEVALPPPPWGEVVQVTARLQRVVAP
jgi:hypothetical protein